MQSLSQDLWAIHIMKKVSPETDQIIRSLLQKAIRRGDYELTKKTIAYILKIHDFQWMRKRLPVITFEECWPYGLKVAFDNNKNIIIKHYLNLAKTSKNKNASGLGSLAYALSQGDESVYQKDGKNKCIKIVSEAIKRPNDFWIWAYRQNLSTNQRILIENAEKGFKKAGWPWDKAFALAAAYLAITDDIPEIGYTKIISNQAFPLWVSIDKHTKEGKLAIQEAAKQNGVNTNKALWLSFYFEGAKCNQIENSPWWTREIKWKMKKLQLDFDQGKEIWEKISPVIREILSDHVKKLENKLNSIDTNKLIMIESVQMSIF